MLTQAEMDIAALEAEIQILDDYLAKDKAGLAELLQQVYNKAGNVHLFERQRENCLNRINQLKEKGRQLPAR